MYTTTLLKWSTEQMFTIYGIGSRTTDQMFTTIQVLTVLIIGLFTISSANAGVEGMRKTGGL